MSLADDYQKMLDTCESAGIKMISDDHCCRLLAWLYVYGGGNEAVTINMKLNKNIMIAQKRLNLLGGEVPNVELLPTLQSYIREIEPIMHGAKITHPKWVYSICDYYGLSSKLL